LRQPNGFVAEQHLHLDAAVGRGVEQKLGALVAQAEWVLGHTVLFWGGSGQAACAVAPWRGVRFRLQASGSSAADRGSRRIAFGAARFRGAGLR
jgi:hypothetical protein